MLEKFKLKNQYWMPVLAIILLITGYRLAFRKTIKAWQLHQRLQKRVQQSQDLSYQPAYLERRNRNFDKILQLYNADTINYRSNILSVISLEAQQENVKLSEVPSADPSYHSENRIIERLRFEGDYFSLVKVLNRLQSTGNVGVITSVDINAIKLPSTTNSPDKIVMDVYFAIIRTVPGLDL